MAGKSSKGKTPSVQAVELASATHKPEDNQIPILLVGSFYPEAEPTRTSTICIPMPSFPPTTLWCLILIISTAILGSALGCSPRQPSTQPQTTNPPTAPSKQEPSTAKPTDSPQVDFPKEIQRITRLLEECSKSNSTNSSISTDTSEPTQSKKIDEVWAALKPLLLVKPADPDLIFLTARTLAAKNDLPGAIATLEKMPEGAPQAGPAAGQAAEWMIALGKVPEAETILVKLIKQYPNAVPALRLLGKLYNAQGRRWEATRILERLIRLGDFTKFELLAIVDPRDYFNDEPIQKAFAETYPDHPYVLFAPIRTKLIRNGYAANLESLRTMSIRYPDLIEPWVWTATSLLETDRLAELKEWLATPPPEANKHPEYWYATGGLLLRSNQFESAAAAFAQTIQLDRRHVPAYQALADALLELKLVDQAQSVRQFGNDLVSINDLAQQISYNYGDNKLYESIAKIYDKLGDDVAAFGWRATAVALGFEPMTQSLRDQQALLKKGTLRPPAVLDQIPWKNWTLPSELPTPTQSDSFSSTPNNLSNASSIAMEDVAATLGITGRYNNGAKPNRSWYTIEGVGGGVNAMDFDLDGWPDLYFSEAGGSPIDSNPSYQPKSLFRSIYSKAFQDVAQLACVADVGYGQGVGVSDIDQDGFPDLLVSNLGNSRIYRNQGDGSFEAIAIPQDDPNSVWNSSIHAADLNGDSLPDLLVASYLYGTEAITRKCDYGKSSRISCNPKMFPPGKNRILYNQGDGNWKSAPEPLLESIRTGYTLGTLVTNLDQRFGNDVFFANDVSPNNLLLSGPEDPTDPDYFSESAASAGVAVDAIGRAQACMGISCGDQNRDGLLDIIVTNFYNEVSTLYLQTLPGVFVDGTRRSKLGVFTLDQLSFGSQLSDLDNDGWLDFIAVNGHIDDLRTENVPWQMPTQILRNVQGEFQWLRNPAPGKYFESKYVGRGLQSLDYNVDGKPDLVATHLDRPAALLENRTQSKHNFIQFELVGTRCERAAIGAVLHIQSKDQSWVTSLCDGEGYFGSNQHLLHVGIGAQTSIDSVKCTWPNGSVETLSNLQPNRRYRWVEGQGIHEIPLHSNTPAPIRP